MLAACSALLSAVASAATITCAGMPTKAATGGSPAASVAPRPKLNPPPQTAAFATDARVDVGQTPITVCCDDAAAADWAKRHLAGWLRDLRAPDVRRAPRGPELAHGAEAYLLEVKAGGVKIVANALQGVRYALYTYRQAWMAGRGTARLERYETPKMEVEDWPALAFRPIYLCWRRTDEGGDVKFMEHQLRMAAFLKFNYVIFGISTGVRSARHPELVFSEKTSAPMSELKRLADIGRDLGVTVFPGWNCYGHANFAGLNGKHAPLDCRPELQPLFEPHGWNWCLTNPEVVKLQCEMIDEMLDACGNPPYFHIGCDEAQPPSCPDCCARPYHEIVAGHVKALHAHLAARGVRTLMWHDMLVNRHDPRFKGFIRNGSETAEAMLRALPRDIVICDWYYGGCWGLKEKHDTYPTLDYFKAEGFDVVTCPWYNKVGGEAQGKWAREHGLFGLMATVWGRDSGKKYVLVWQNAPSWGWSSGSADELLPSKHDVAVQWRICGWDMNLGPDDTDVFGFVSQEHSRAKEPED